MRLRTAFFTAVDTGLSRAVRTKVDQQPQLTGTLAICIHECSYRTKEAAVKLRPLAVDDHENNVMVLHPGMFTTQSLLQMRTYTQELGALTLDHLAVVFRHHLGALGSFSFSSQQKTY